ncbi:hypothetical protein KJ632_05010 [Patescibacteria group bacterium]|nr:hypothetical protein [Patescibacteria group bacterium]
MSGLENSPDCDGVDIEKVRDAGRNFIAILCTQRKEVEGWRLTQAEIFNNIDTTYAGISSPWAFEEYEKTTTQIIDYVTSLLGIIASDPRSALAAAEDLEDFLTHNIEEQAPIAQEKMLQRGSNTWGNSSKSSVMGQN